MILANSSAIGMQPRIDQTPVCKEALKSYDLVFDAVYTPRNTRLLQEAAEVGAAVVSGVEMFIRQALGQFKLFTDGLGTVSSLTLVCLFICYLCSLQHSGILRLTVLLSACHHFKCLISSLVFAAPEDFMRKIVLEQF
nr:bifunctional 3-dehydroquinate dehydratase/shikimate dehydrogenase, chloroplastic-like [Ipomoea batatas]